MLLQKTDVNADEKADESVKIRNPLLSGREEKDRGGLGCRNIAHSLVLSFLSSPNERKYFEESKRG